LWKSNRGDFGVEEGEMKRTLAGLILFGVVSTALGGAPRPQSESQGAKQDVKDAGHDTKQAAKKTGSAVEKTTKKGVNKSAHEVKKGAAKVEGKTEPQ
jgi:hypothetical protein